MAIAAMVNRSGLVASREGGRLDSAVASFAALADMRRIVAADSSRAPRARQTLHRSAAVENARRNRTAIPLRMGLKPVQFSTSRGTDAVATYLLRLTSTSIVYAWMYNNTNGNLLIAMLTHLGHNLEPVLYRQRPTQADSI